MIEPIPYMARVVHIAGAVALIGGLFRSNGPLVTAGIVAAMFLTGIYNLMNRMAAGVPKEFHMVFGLKFLLVLHIAAVSILAAKESTAPDKRARMLKGVMMSGFVVIALSAALRAF